MVKLRWIKGRKSTFEKSEPKHPFRLRQRRMLLTYDCTDSEYLVHYAADYFPYDERAISERVTIDKSSSEGTAKAGGQIWEYELQMIDGIKLEDGAVEPRYLSTQHERDPLTNFDFRGARYYDSEFATFLSVDPLASKMAAWSPYVYTFSNPIYFTDPTGMQPDPIEKAQKKWDKHISKPIFKAFREGINNGSISPGDMESARVVLEPLVAKLQAKHGRKKWFGFYSRNTNKKGVASSTTGNRRVNNKSKHDVTINLFSTGGSPIKLQDGNSNAPNGTIRLSNGENFVLNSPKNLTEEQLSSGGFTFSFDSRGNPDQINIYNSNCNLSFGQIYGNNSTNGISGTGVLPFNQVGGSITTNVQSALGGVNNKVSEWNLSLGYYYLNPQPRTFSGEHKAN